MNWDSIELKWTEMARRAIGDTLTDVLARQPAASAGVDGLKGEGTGNEAISGATASTGKPELTRA